MKKIFSLALVLVMLLSFAACGNKEKSAENDTTTTAAAAALTPDVVIKEASYVTYINDIYNNPDNYIGKVIQIDGMYTYEDFIDQGGGKYYYVYRQGPGCCGNDGSMCGLEFSSADGTYPDYIPQSGDDNAAHPWIMVTGTLRQYYEGETGPYYTLDNASYEIMTTRGAEVVSL